MFGSNTLYRYVCDNCHQATDKKTKRKHKCQLCKKPMRFGSIVDKPKKKK